MNSMTTIAASAFVTLALLVPAGASAQRHASPGTETGSSAGSRDGGDSAPSGGGGSVSAPSVPSAPMPRTATESGGQRPARTATGRERGDRPQVGTAGPRGYTSNPGGSPQYQYSTRPIPYWWYSAYAPGFGFTSYDLWSWGLGSDLWWYRPYGYQPYAPYGFGLGSYGYGYGGGGTSWSDDRDDRPTGSIRLRVSPRNAKVYVDGALAGVVDEFDGLTDHLQLDPGRHQIELRATGYESFVADVNVTDGRTTTTRAKLKKTK